MDPNTSPSNEVSLGADGELLRFPVVGDISHAAHYVAANWPPDSTQRPRFDTVSHPMVLIFELRAQSVRTLQDLLGHGALIQGPLARSARAFRMQLARKLVGRPIPSSTGFAAGGRAG
jgi:hypothetical protein